MAFEGFNCKQCGRCCIKIDDAFCGDCDEQDYERWEDECRDDILDWIDVYKVDEQVVAMDAWINPTTYEPANRCPWLEKLPKQKGYACRINDTKPKKCREYPKSLQHGVDTGCPVCVSLSKKINDKV